MTATSLRSRMVAYCVASFGFTLLSSTFSFYYVKVFLNLYHIDEGWFHLAQVLYLVWNAINDPLFAYWQDTSTSWLVRTRRELILYTGPLFGLAYLVAWFPWGNSGWITGVHLIVSLCLYDTMFTFIGLARCCLFTEMTVTEIDRIRLTRYSQVASFIGSFSVTLCEFTSNSLKNFHNFQLTAVCIAIVSSIAMYYCGKHAHTHYDIKKLTKEQEEVKEPKSESPDESSYWKLGCQFLSNRNFISFVITNFLQEFHRAFNFSFTVIICDQLINESDVGPHVRSVFYASRNSLHTLFLVLGAPVIDRMGYFSVIRGNFPWKIISSIIIAHVGRSNPWLFMVFLLCDSAYTNLSFAMFNLPLSDVADENMQQYKRKKPLSSIVFGTNALFVKPSQSLSPMLVVAVLNKYGYEDFKKGTLSGSDVSQLKDVMFQLTWCLPLVVGILQTVSWSFWTLRRRHGPNVSVDVPA